ncbi:MAG: hypothetical protein WBV94_33190 [Blastocatellia bacterium]
MADEIVNRTEENIADGIAAVIESVTTASVVISDEKFSEATADLLRLLASAAKGKPLSGWVMSFDQIVSQDDEGTGQVAIVYGYELTYIQEYLNKWPTGGNSKKACSREIFTVNNALNIKRNLGFDNNVRHQCLVSTEPIGMGESTGPNKLFHIAPFSLNVQDINYYQESY